MPQGHKLIFIKQEQIMLNALEYNSPKTVNTTPNYILGTKLKSIVYTSMLVILKLPFLFAAWLFWTFHNKSYNMKALVIHKHQSSHLFIYMEKNTHNSQ